MVVAKSKKLDNAGPNTHAIKTTFSKAIMATNNVPVLVAI